MVQCEGPPTPMRVYGLDFSGAVRAGEKIWLADGAFDGERLHVDCCLRGADLPDSGRVRETCLAALRAFIGAAGESAFGCDFPFALPRSLMPERCWEEFVGAFARRYPDAGSFRAACLAAAGGRELRRLCDVESRTPFSVYNLRLYRQTHAGITGLLAPLVANGAVRALPMQAPRPGRARLLEVCPASALKRLGWYLPGYKGRSDDSRLARGRILAALEATGRLVLAPHLREPVLADAEGDALDSVIAAFATAEAFREPAVHARATEPAYAIEGYVYA